MASRLMRSWAIGVCMTALVAASAPRPAMAQGSPAAIQGSEEANFGRIVLTLPGPQATNVRISNGVLIVGFSEPVAALAVEAVVRQMPSYISVARVDPDGRGLRFALTRQLRLSKLEAGERIFIDLIPPNWQGMLPSLPQDVVRDLARRAQAAEAAARAAGRTRAPVEPTLIEAKVSQLPTLARIVFELPREAQADAAIGNGGVDLVFSGGVRFEPARLRPLLPDGVAIGSHESRNGTVKLRLNVGEDRTIRHFREEDGFVVDLATRNRPQPPAAQAVPPPAQAQPQTTPQPQTAAQPQSAAQPQRSTQAQPPQPAPAEPRRPTELAAAPPAEPAPQRQPPAQTVGVAASVAQDGARLDLRFPRRTAAAAFRDGAETVLLFDTIDSIDPAAVAAAAPGFVLGAELRREGRASMLRLALREGGVVRFAPEGNNWVLTAGDAGVAASSLLRPSRKVDEEGRTTLSVPLAGVTAIHWITGEDGQPLAVATSFGPGATLPKPQRYVELQLEQSMHGLVVRPIADDIAVRAGVAEVAITRAGGLALSLEVEQVAQGAEPTQTGSIIERTQWEQMRLGDPRKRLAELMRASAMAQRSERPATRIALATHLLANGLQAEALGPLVALQAEEPAKRGDRRVRLLQAIAHTMMHRSKPAEEALKADSLKDSVEADLWRAVNDARQGRFPRAHAAFRRAAGMVDGYPDMLQALIRPEMARAAIAMRDQAAAEQTLGVLADLAPMWLPRDQVALLQAELDEMAGRLDAALTSYKTLFESVHRPVAARAQLRGIQLAHREQDKSISREEAQARLETVAVTWRGDETEIEALGELGQMYVEDGRWRDAFGLARRASSVFPDHPITRRLHDEAAKHFEELFASGKGDTLPRAEAVALFYDFKEFMPIGRRGDEIIRKLADRLVALDLLDQAAEILQHQIENRLQGAQRAAVAARLAMVRLMNRQPAEALRMIGSTRMAEMPRDVRRARQLLEAKALSDLSRTDLALDILSGESGPEVDRLRADILWSARRWREAGEAHERILGDAWRKTEPLNERERADALRAAVAYVMSEEALAIDRLRTKFAAPMAQTPDARMFAFITGLDRARPGDVRELARAVASADTLTEFMNEYRKRYPEMATSVRGRPVPGQGEQPAQPLEGPPAGVQPAGAQPAGTQPPGQGPGQGPGQAQGQGPGQQRSG